MSKNSTTYSTDYVVVQIRHYTTSSFPPLLLLLALTPKENNTAVSINKQKFCNIFYGTNTTLYILCIPPPTVAAYPHAEREYFHETLEAEEAGQRGVHVMQDRFVRFCLFVVLKREQL
jgi:hypothetical protein